MNYKKFLGAASAALMIVIVIFMLASGAWAQSKFKTLYKFTDGRHGGQPVSSLIIDQAGNLYGTTTLGGPAGCSTPFWLAASDGRHLQRFLLDSRKWGLPRIRENLVKGQKVPDRA